MLSSFQLVEIICHLIINQEWKHYILIMLIKYFQVPILFKAQFLVVSNTVF